MSLCSAITNNKSLLKFRIPLPETTSKRSHYSYQQLLLASAETYLKRNHPNAKHPNKTLIRFQEIYDGRKYLQFTIPVFNHKNETKIIEVEN